MLRLEGFLDMEKEPSTPFFKMGGHGHSKEVVPGVDRFVDLLTPTGDPRIVAAGHNLTSALDIDDKTNRLLNYRLVDCSCCCKIIAKYPFFPVLKEVENILLGP